MPSEIITEDDIIRKRLLIDGEGSGEEKRVVNLLKTFVKWVRDPNPDDASFHKMIAVLSQCEMTVDKLQVVRQMNEEEAQNYAKLNSEIEGKIEEGKTKITNYKKRLAEAKLIKSNKQQYDAIAKIIKEYPSRDETTEVIAKIETEISDLKKKKESLDEEVAKRKRQFEVLVHSIQQLQSELQESTKEETESMDTS